MVYSAALGCLSELDFRVWLRYSPCDNLGSILRLDGPRRGVRGVGKHSYTWMSTTHQAFKLTLVFAIMQISSLWRQEGKAIAEGPETFRKGYETFSMKVPKPCPKVSKPFVEFSVRTERFRNL
ncbi:hypothetical protein GQ457_02G043400 [Hibiscus cannabinus]